MKCYWQVVGREVPQGLVAYRRGLVPLVVAPSMTGSSIWDENRAQASAGAPLEQMEKVILCITQKSAEGEGPDTLGADTNHGRRHRPAL